MTKIADIKKIFIPYRSTLEEKEIVGRYSKGTKQTFNFKKYQTIVHEWLPFTTQPATILDIGCGEGTVTNFLKKEFPNAKCVIGVDISEEMIDVAKQTYKGIDFRMGEMDKLPLGDGEADFIFSRLAIHYSQDLRKTLAEVARVARPGALFFIKDAHPFFATFLKESLDYNQKEDVIFHAQCDDDIEVIHPTFTVEEYINGFIATGWEIVSMHEPYGRGATKNRSGAYKVPTSICFVLRRKQ
ncbi:MAG TPA: class I SAM-dependent methyltransferase [Candidatus Saccharimonadales bacterium]